MSVRSHIAEILRQGVWASLSGGWFYDPRQSLFCNTVHLYLWLLLLISPLILGLTAGTALSLVVIGCYSCAVGISFIIIKTIVWYLHGIFDTNDPLPLAPIDDPNSRQTSFAVDGLTTRSRTDITSYPEEGAGGNDIEMTVIKRPDEANSTISASAPGFLDVAETVEDVRPRRTNNGRRSVRICQLPTAGNSDLAVTADVHVSQSDIKAEDDGSDEGSDPHSDKVLLSKQRIELPVDSLELLPVVRRPSDVDGAAEDQDSNSYQSSNIRRKYSEPNIYPYGTSLRRRSRRGSAGTGVRRVRSSLETSNRQRSGLVLSQQTLEECKLKGTRKSYPSKTSSTDIFLMQGRPARDELLDEKEISSEESSGIAVNVPEDSLVDLTLAIREEPEREEQFDQGTTTEESNDKQTSSDGDQLKNADEDNKSEGDQSAHSEESPSIKNRRSQLMRSLRQTIDAWRMDTDTVEPQTPSSPELSSPRRSVTPDLTWLFDEAEIAKFSQPKSSPEISKKKVLDEEEDDDDIVPLPAEKGSDRIKKRPRTYAFTRSQEREPRPGTSSGPNSAEVMDLKEELARLLEEIIETHPEALEAIESVRQRRNMPGSSIDTAGPSSSQAVIPSTGSNRSSMRQTRNRSVGSTSRVTGSLPSYRGTEASALAEIAVKPGTHVAANYEDTTFGAVHNFQDEDGNWYTYTFDPEGHGTAQALGNSKALMEMISAQQQVTRSQKSPWLSEAASALNDFDLEAKHDLESAVRHRRTRSNSSSSTEDPFSDPFVSGPASILHPSSGSQVSREPPLFNLAQRLRSVTRQSTRGSTGSNSDRRHRLQLMMERTLAAAAAASQQQVGNVTTPGDYSTATLGISGSVRTSSLGSGSSLNRIRFLTDITGMSAAGTSVDSHRASMRRKYYYPITPMPKWLTKKTFKLRFDRLSLLSLFDRNTSVVSVLSDAILAAFVAFFACLLLQKGLYHDFQLLLFSVVVAGAQFSLLKSVQPDASSPIHGYNWIVTYSRPSYFCLMAAIILLLDWIGPIGMETIEFDPNQIQRTREFFAGFLLFLPAVFAVGLLPQVNTFTMHCLEQIEMHLLGGTATFSLLSAVFSIGKSLLTVAILYVFASAGGWTGVDENNHKHVLFSLFCAVLVSVSYLLSRSSSNPRLLWCALHHFSGFKRNRPESGPTEDTNPGPVDPLPGRLKETMTTRIKHDLLVSVLMGFVTFGIHCSTVFADLQPYLTYSLIGIGALMGIINHYLWPQLRKQSPWLLMAQPVFKPHEFNLFETFYMARIMWFERLSCWLAFIERNVLYPLLILSSVTWYMKNHETKWYPQILLPIVGLKLLRSAYCNAAQLYVPLICTSLLFWVDFGAFLSHDGVLAFPVSFYLLVALWPKLRELMLKLQFIFAYVAPWQISWGSAFHAFAQPFSVPHSALTLAQATISSLLSAPLNPFLGSSFFLTSYMRPVKFWERDYNTKRVDHSNTRLITQIDRGPMTDDSNLNAIFYEHLTRSLQQSLAGDIALGRWATTVAPGDCFILASFYLNCLVHIIEVGNGFITFQLRGLEFRGTYCQQREVEAISEDIADSDGCCCCELGHLPGFLSLNTAWTLRWLAWEVTATKYVVEGYSITDNSAISMLQVHELRRLLVTLYVKCIIYYAMLAPKLEEWLCTDTITAALDPIVQNSKYLDVDPMFCVSNDEDYDVRLSGVSRQSFCQLYMDWIEYCVQRRSSTPFTSGTDRVHCDRDGILVGFCFALSLVGRRALGAAAHNRHSSAAESFLYGLHSLFKGDFRITSTRDEWVFADMDLLRCIIAPAVRMALKLHQDHFTAADDFEEPPSLFRRITSHESSLFISHEHDPAWRQAILANTPSLLALRHVFDDGNDDYKVIMLNRRHLTFRVIKLNKECVRSFWSGQQQELIFLRNRNPERGSIQNARQVLRNMINSSADQPIGYPIYVSPLTTSFVESHTQIAGILGPPFTLDLIGKGIRNLWHWLSTHCGTSGSSNLSLPQLNPVVITSAQPRQTQERSGARTEPTEQVHPTPLATVDEQQQSIMSQRSSSTFPPLAYRGDISVPLQRSSSQPIKRRSDTSLERMRHCRLSGVDGSTSAIRSDLEDINGQDSLVILGRDGRVRVSLHKESTPISTNETDEISSSEMVKIKDLSSIFDHLNEPLSFTGLPVVTWPSEDFRKKGGKSGWAEWNPKIDMEGEIVHKWTPSNPVAAQRSHIGTVILLIKITGDSDRFVPIAEAGIEVLS